MTKESFKKCSFCKMKYRINSLKEFKKSNHYNFLGSIYVCKVCLKNVDVENYKETLRDKYIANTFRCENRKNGINDEQTVQLQLLLVKLKREIKNEI
jgi:uncharacterized CHY-type Zn-finger protein